MTLLYHTNPSSTTPTPTQLLYHTPGDLPPTPAPTQPRYHTPGDLGATAARHAGDVGATATGRARVASRGETRAGLTPSLT